MANVKKGQPGKNIPKKSESKIKEENDSMLSKKTYEDFNEEKPLPEEFIEKEEVKKPVQKKPKDK